MALHWKGLVIRSLLFLIILSGQNSLCSVEEERVEIIQGSDNKKNALKEHCWGIECSENEFCNEICECECRPGFISRNNVCVPCAGENEKCITSNDCNETLFCINGICRKPTPNAEFITLAKICLGITVISILVALLSSFLKCLLRFDSFQRFNLRWGSNGGNPPNTQDRHVSESQPSPIIIQDEKPPSYEECVLSGRGTSFADSPPPYVISSDAFATSKQNQIFPKTTAAQSPLQL